MQQKYLFQVLLVLAFKRLLAATNKDCDSHCSNCKICKPMVEHSSLMDQRWPSCNITVAAVEQHRDKVNDFEHKMVVTIEELAKQKKIMEQVKCSTPFQKLGNKYYYIEESENMNWFAAAHRCHELGSHLVHLESLNELNLVSAKLKSSNDYWVDMNDLSKEGEFISLTTGVKPEFQEWHKDEPNKLNKGENCVDLTFREASGKQFKMNDMPCDSKEYFICESPMYAACEND